jgi:hypothetical protein
MSRGSLFLRSRSIDTPIPTQKLLIFTRTCVCHFLAVRASSRLFERPHCKQPNFSEANHIISATIPRDAPDIPVSWNSFTCGTFHLVDVHGAFRNAVQIYVSTRRRVMFTRDDDARLRELGTRSQARDWIAIAQQMQTRRLRESRDSWKNSFVPDLHPAPWSSSELGHK